MDLKHVPLSCVLQVVLRIVVFFLDMGPEHVPFSRLGEVAQGGGRRLAAGRLVVGCFFFSERCNEVWAQVPGMQKLLTHRQGRTLP